VSRYFEIASFGRCYSLGHSLMILSGGASPVLIAHLSPSGDYTLALAVSTIGLALSAASVAFLPHFTLLPTARVSSGIDDDGGDLAGQARSRASFQQF